MLIDTLLTSYRSYHTNTNNIITHYFGIPLIVFAIMVLLRQFVIFDWVTAAEVFLVGIGFFYIYLNPKLGGLTLLLFGIIPNIVAIGLPYPWLGHVAFVVGWLLQVWGHYAYEKRAPAFTTNGIHLLVGPLFLVNELFKIREEKGDL